MAASRMAVSRRAVVTQQRRGFIDYLVNYPDHVRFLFFVFLVELKIPNSVGMLRSVVVVVAHFLSIIYYISQVLQKKAIQCKGGTRLGEANPTWLKQPGDSSVVAFGAALVTFGMLQLGYGFFNLSFNKNKKD